MKFWVRGKEHITLYNRYLVYKVYNPRGWKAQTVTALIHALDLRRMARLSLSVVQPTKGTFYDFLCLQRKAGSETTGGDFC